MKPLQKFKTSALVSFFATVLLLSGTPCQGDVLFVHDYKIKEYMIGEKDAELSVAYTDQEMVVDKHTRYVGSWMKRIFGDVREARDTTRFLLDKNQIREIDWYMEKVIVHSFEKLTDITWIRQQEKTAEAVQDILKERYRVLEPVFSIKAFPEAEKIGDHPCRHVEANLRLETRDMKKDASSVTLINQHLWVSDAVPGFDVYQAFHSALAKKLGLDATRLGNLTFFLRYWHGSLKPISRSLELVRGYPVKSVLTVDGQYTKEVSTDSPKIHSFQIKKESMQLREILPNRLEQSRFREPADFKVVISGSE